MSKIVEPKILSGFMELLPAQQIIIERIKKIIQNNFEHFGFTPLDTPVIELSEVLLAKAGGETEKQIYQFQKGDNDLSLRFDLTVPLARYVAMHQNELTFPFKRYQIGKVYRGERPQKGRFREFYQCDIDIIGREKLNILNDAELPCVIYNIFTQIGLKDFTISINNRKILKGFFESLGLASKSSDILRITDKIAKIGQKNVTESLIEIGISSKEIEAILNFITTTGQNNEVLKTLSRMDITNDDFVQGILEIKEVLRGLNQLGVPEEFYKLDLSISRGLDYYTGTIYETTLNKYPQFGSICSGGRYDNLASFYTTTKLPGVGISIGLTRLFDQFCSAGFIKGYVQTPSCILILPMSIQEQEMAFSFSAQLREKNVNVEVFIEDIKFPKKMTYANKIGVPMIAIIGENERNSGTIVIKDMVTAEQKVLPIDQAVKFVVQSAKQEKVLFPVQMPL